MPEEYAMDFNEMSAIIDKALASAAEAGVRGKKHHPYLLAHIVEYTGGRSLATNIQLAPYNNARVAAAIAVELQSCNLYLTKNAPGNCLFPGAFLCFSAQQILSGFRMPFGSNARLMPLHQLHLHRPVLAGQVLPFGPADAVLAGHKAPPAGPPRRTSAQTPGQGGGQLRLVQLVPAQVDVQVAVARVAKAGNAQPHLAGHLIGIADKAGHAASGHHHVAPRPSAWEALIASKKRRVRPTRSFFRSSVSTIKRPARPPAGTVRPPCPARPPPGPRCCRQKVNRM